MPDIENSRKTAAKGAEWVTVKQLKNSWKNIRNTPDILKPEFFEQFTLKTRTSLNKSQDTQPPLTPRQGMYYREVECQTPACSTTPNSCSTGSALWEFFRTSAALQGKWPWQGGCLVKNPLKAVNICSFRSFPLKSPP